MDIRPLNYLSICIGMYGLDFGIELAMPHARCVCMVEGETYCAALLSQRMEEGALAPAPIWSDVRTFDGKPWRGIVDMLVGGIPCQPHSVAGKQLGADDERDLWPDAARIIGEIGPALVFLENVGGAAGYFCGTVAPELERMGYRVAAGLFTAAEVGASHERERLFMLAYSTSMYRKQHEGIGAGPGEESRTGTRNQFTGSSEHMAYCDSMADASHGQLSQPRRGSQRRNGVGSAEPEMADACYRVERKELRPNGGVGSFSASCRQPLRSTGYETVLDYPASTRCDDAGQWPEAIGESGQCVSGAGCYNFRRPLFAPGPASADWPAILERWPELAPATESAVRGVADGLAPRMDRLRGTGNGVVSLAAGIAFAVLAAALCDGETE